MCVGMYILLCVYRQAEKEGERNKKRKKELGIYLSLIYK